MNRKIDKNRNDERKIWNNKVIDNFLCHRLSGNFRVKIRQKRRKELYRSKIEHPKFESNQIL